MTGTCAEYGDVEGLAQEALPCRPRSAYAATKHAAVNLACADARETGRPVVVLRPFGPFGPGDDPLRVLPAAIAGLIEGRDVALGDGTAVRDFSYVDDHVDAVLCAATVANLAPGTIYNIGTGRGLTIRTALERVAALVNGPGRLMFGARPAAPGDLREMVADVSAARRELGFEVRTTFDQAVLQTAAHMRERLRPDVTTDDTRYRENP
jgi:nucleoside-diphosphate-sugar epimerase